MRINLAPLVDTELDLGSQTYAAGRIDTPSMKRVNVETSWLGERNTP